jgi:hypothetical protein
VTLPEFLHAHAEQVESLTTNREVWDHQKRWREAFGLASQTLGRLSEWEAVASGATPAASGARATVAFEWMLSEQSSGASVSPDLLVTQHLGQRPLFLVRRPHASMARAVLEEWQEDLYVTPVCYAWTFVRTHEEPYIGPFFMESESA